MVRQNQVKDIADPAFSGRTKLTVNKCRILTANSLEEAPGKRKYRQEDTMLNLNSIRNFA